MEHQGHTGEKKGLMEKIREKLPGGHADHQQTGGNYGQQGHTGTAATHGAPVTGGTYGQQGHVGTGTHGTPATGDTYGQQGHTGVTGTGTHGTTATGGTYGKQGHTGTTGTGTHDGTGEKKSIMDKIKDKLPGQH